MDALADATTTLSYRKQVTLEQKKFSVGRVANCERRQRAKQVCIMAEWCRQNHRKRIREATSITLAFDEAKRRRLVRFRCDTPRAPYTAPGILGIVSGHFRSIDEVTDDYATAAGGAVPLILHFFFNATGWRLQ